MLTIDLKFFSPVVPSKCVSKQSRFEARKEEDDEEEEKEEQTKLESEEEG